MTVYWVLAYYAPKTSREGQVAVRESFSDVRIRDAVANGLRAQSDISPVITWKTADMTPLVLT